MANRYLTVGHNSSPYITTYSQSGDTFTKIANPSILPVADGYSVDWNYNATSLAVATFDNSPYVIVYNVSDGVYTKVAELSDVAGSLAVAWSPDGSKLAVGDIASPYIRIYNRSGDTFTQISNPATLPAGAAQELAWSPDGAKLAVAHGTSPYFTVYTVSGDTFTKVADPSLLPYNNGLSVAWNSDSDVLAVGGEGSASIQPGRIYNFLSNTLSFASNIGATGIGVLIARQTITWRPNGSQLAIRDTIYDRSGNTYSTAGSNITVSGTVQAVNWDTSGNVIAIGHTSSPYVSIFNQVSSSGFVKISDPAVLPTGIVRSTAWGYGVVTQSAISSITSQVNLSAAAGISTQSGSATLTTISTLSARVLGDILYVVDGYIDADYFIAGSDFDYFEPDYIEDDYVAQPFVTATVSTTSAFSFTADTVKLRQQSSSISTALSLASTGDKIRYADVNLVTATTLSSLGSRTRSAEVSLSAFNTTLTVGDRSRPAQAQLASVFTQSAQANYTLSPNISLTTTATVSASMVVNRPASASLSAFNTVLTAGARIRSLGTDMTVAASLSATAGKIRTAATNNNLLTINPTPYTGIYVDRADHFATLDDEEFLIPFGPETPVNGSEVSSWINEATVSFWARCDDSAGGTIFSAPGVNDGEPGVEVLNRENALTLTLSPSLLTFGYNYSAGSARTLLISAAIPEVLPGEWHHYWVEVTHDGSPYSANVFVDGELVYSTSGAYNPVTVTFLEAFNPLRIGITHRPSAQLPLVPTYSNRFKGAIVQLWINNSNNNVNEFYDANNPISPFIELGPLGRKTNNSLPQPIWYNDFNYPFDGNVTGISANAGSFTGSLTSETIDTDYLPNPGNQPILARFTTVFSGDRTVFAEFSANSVTSLTSTASYNKPGSANLAVVSTFTAASYDFTKATVSLSSAVSLTAIADRIKYAQVNISSALSATLTASDRNSGSANLSAEFTISADPTTNVLGIVSAQLTTSFSAQAYDFTKAQATISANFTLLSEGRYEERIRANAAIASSFTTSVSGVVTRSAVSSVNSLASVAIANGLALRRGNIAMSAFNTVLTAGKLIEFYAENTIKVAQELGLLHVYDDRESNVLLVQDDQELNKIYVDDGLETTKIYPEQETGVLLAQHRQPTF